MPLGLVWAEEGISTRNKTISFDAKAKLYDSWYQTPLGALCDTLEKEAIFSLISVRESECVLGVGCGTGVYLLELAQRGAQVAGVDSSPNMIEIAQRKLAGAGYAAHLKLADAEALPFPDDTFDTALSVLLLEFVAAPQKIIREMFRVVKPGGRLVIGTLNRYSVWALRRSLLTALGSSKHVRATYLTRRYLNSLLLAEGGRDLLWRSAIYFPPVDNHFFLRTALFLENIGHRVLPFSGAFLAVRANKLFEP